MSNKFDFTIYRIVGVTAIIGAKIENDIPLLYLKDVNFNGATITPELTTTPTP